MILIKLIVACMLIPVPVNLRDAYCRATFAWGRAPNVREVRWCADADECVKMHAAGGGEFNYASKTIVLDSGRVDQNDVHPSYRGMSEDQERYLILVHEVGHSLGLIKHFGDGVMHDGWSAPMAEFPDEQELNWLRTIERENPR